MPRRKVLLVQPSLQPPGGGNGVAAWALQALAPHHDVTVLTWWPLEVEPINHFFGTSLRTGEFATRTVPASWRLALDHLPMPAALLRSALLMRYTRRQVHGFDVVLSLHNEVDYGRRGIQYIHYPTYVRPRPAVDLRWYHLPALLRAYYTAADGVAGFSLARVRRNLTLVNSDWTGAEAKKYLGLTTTITLYPPVADPEPPWPWPARRRGFLAIGRMSPEKEYERILEIVARVRQRHPDLTLTIVTTVDSRTRALFKRVTALAAALDPERAWITFRLNLSRDEVRQLIAGHRYGIHGMREEHFGMAPAEMARGGMIVWVPNGGGQVEIVGDEPLLRYDTPDEAVAHILAVLEDSTEETRLREHLRQHTERFGVERFQSRVRTIVEQFDA